MCSLFERVTIFCVILGMKQTVNTRRESGICQFPPLFYFRVSQPLRNLFSPFFSSFKFSLNRVQIYIYIYIYTIFQTSLKLYIKKKSIGDKITLFPTREKESFQKHDLLPRLCTTSRPGIPP